MVTSLKTGVKGKHARSGRFHHLLLSIRVFTDVSASLLLYYGAGGGSSCAHPEEIRHPELWTLELSKTIAGLLSGCLLGALEVFWSSESESAVA